MSNISIPHIDQYLGVWAIEETRFWSWFEHAQQLNLHLHLQSDAVAVAQASAARGESFQRIGSAALVPLYGKLMKHQSSMGDSTSTVLARRQIRAATRDEDISHLMIHIDSGGGTVAGTAELAAEVLAASQVKPTHAYIQDIGASAAYWIASQATRVSVNATGIVGSIGTYGVVYDTSGRAAQQGVKAHVIRAGKYKGAGIPGTEVTVEQLAEMQRTIDALNEHFLASVSSGRKLSMDQVRELADGRAHVGKEALKLKLVDAVETFDQAFSQLMTPASSRSKRMATSQLVPQAEDLDSIAANLAQQRIITAQAVPQRQQVAGEILSLTIEASYQEIKAGCAGADPAFICSQLESKATLAQAQSAWMLALQKRCEAAEATAKEANEKIKALASKPGVESLATKEGKATEASSAHDQFFAEVDAKVKAGLSRPRAISAVTKANPDLHAAMLQEANASRPARR